MSARWISGLAGSCLVMAALLCAAACGGPAPEPPAGDAGPQLEIVDPTAHLMPQMGAVYLTIVNHGDQADRLVSIDSPIASAAETHETLVQEGVMRMVPRPEGFTIPAGGTVKLEPSGKHIMLIQPTLTSEAATLLPVTLHFEHSGSLEVEARILALTQGGGGE